MELIKFNSAADFRFAAVVEITPNTSQHDLAVHSLLECVDSVWHEMPLPVQDFFLRFMKSLDVPIDYPSLPFWAERAARSVLLILYPTLRKSNFRKPTPEDLGRICGHLLAYSLHAKEGTAIFARLPKETSEEAKKLFGKVEIPLRVLIDEALNQTPDESASFLRGMNHAFAKTFDSVGLPFGWNTNSPVMLGLCLGWHIIATKSPTMSELHRGLAKLLGEQIVGSEDRVKKICHRLGLRFSGDRTIGSQGTSAILDVPSRVERISDK